jgi:hypothetical protein
MNQLDQLLRQFEGADYYSEEPDPGPHPAAGLFLISASLIGWAAFVGAAYALYQAIQALA